MPRLTKQRALEVCIEMWDWLAENPDKQKHHAIEELNLDSDELGGYNCSACAYEDQMRESITCKGLVAKRVCHYCPMWTGKEKCNSSTSPYHIWLVNSAYSLRSEAAKDIANLAREKLAKLQND